MLLGIGAALQALLQLRRPGCTTRQLHQETLPRGISERHSTPYSAAKHHTRAGICSLPCLTEQLSHTCLGRAAAAAAAGNQKQPMQTQRQRPAATA